MRLSTAAQRRANLSVANLRNTRSPLVQRHSPGALDALRQSTNPPAVVSTMLSHVVRCRRRIVSGTNLFRFPRLIQTRSIASASSQPEPSRLDGSRTNNICRPTFRPAPAASTGHGGIDQTKRGACAAAAAVNRNFRAMHEAAAHRGPTRALATTVESSKPPSTLLARKYHRGPQFSQVAILKPRRAKNRWQSGKAAAPRAPRSRQNRFSCSLRPDFSDGFDRYNLHVPPPSGNGTTMQRLRRCSEFA